MTANIHKNLPVKMSVNLLGVKCRGELEESLQKNNRKIIQPDCNNVCNQLKY